MTIVITNIISVMQTVFSIINARSRLNSSSELPDNHEVL